MAERPGGACVQLDPQPPETPGGPLRPLAREEAAKAPPSRVWAERGAEWARGCGRGGQAGRGGACPPAPTPTAFPPAWFLWGPQCVLPLPVPRGPTPSPAPPVAGLLGSPWGLVGRCPQKPAPCRNGRERAAPWQEERVQEGILFVYSQSTVCEKIMELLGQNEVDHRQRKLVILSQDRFYKVLTAEQKAKALKGQYNFDHPGAEQDPEGSRGGQAKGSGLQGRMGMQRGPSASMEFAWPPGPRAAPQAFPASLVGASREVPSRWRGPPLGSRRNPCTLPAVWGPLCTAFCISPPALGPKSLRGQQGKQWVNQRADSGLIWSGQGTGGNGVDR